VQDVQCPQVSGPDEQPRTLIAIPPMSECHPYRGTDGTLRCEHTHAYWYAAALLLDCPYCQAAPFEPCRTLPTWNPRTAELVGGGRQVPSPRESHSGRLYQGFALIRKAMIAAGSERRANNDEPPLPPLSADDVVAIVEAVINARPRTQPTRKRATQPTRKRASRKQ
jgi:hypothetical protein